MTYPQWIYFPRNVRPPTWARSFVEVVKSAESKISTVEHKTGLDSDAVLRELAPGLVVQGYAVESGKTKAAKIHRPVLFGENGTRRSTKRSTPSKMSSASPLRWKRAGARRETRITGTSFAPR